MSEEDIKLLKEMKQNCLTKKEYIDPKAEIKAQAIENVLNRLAELEKENKRKTQRLDRQFKLLIKKDKLIKNSIPKSVIREKIEELENNRKMNIMARSSQIDILKEILE